MSVAVSCIDFDCANFRTRPSGEGFGDSSKKIVQNIKKEISQMWGSESLTFGRPLCEALVLLLKTYRECSREGWDGYGAAAITDDAYEEAKTIINLLPSSIPMPDIVAEPTGDIGFEWRRGKGQIFIISVSGKHRINYAGILGGNKVQGTECFEETLPSVIMQRIRRLYSER
jgi:hypothetical protein